MIQRQRINQDHEDSGWYTSAAGSLLALKRGTTVLQSNGITLELSLPITATLTGE